jgi:hypothetical protein
VDKARFYSPYINRFIQPDSIVPSPANPQSLNRFSYVYNNSVRFNDPTGHMCREDGKGCDGSFLQNTRIGNTILKSSGKKESAGYEKRWLKRHLKDTYDLNVADDFSVEELRKIRETAQDIEVYADSLTDGNGREWMLRAFGNTTIAHGNDSNGRSFAWPWIGIQLDQNWMTHSWGAKVLLAHELGHVWDINTGFAASLNMNRDLGGKGVCLFCIPGTDVPQWRPDYHLDKNTGIAYGNGGRNEYFAEAFSATIYNRVSAPNHVAAWIDSQIANPGYFPPWR